LISEPVSRVLFYISFVILISNLFLWPVVLGVFAARLIGQVTVFMLNQKKFNEPGLLHWVPIFDIISPFINAVLYAGSLREGTGKNKWK
jgi:hypothetical protein